MENSSAVHTEVMDTPDDNTPWKLDTRGILCMDRERVLVPSDEQQDDVGRKGLDEQVYVNIFITHILIPT